MDKALRSRAIVVGHLILTVPAIAGILLVPFFGLRELGQTLFLCYILAGIALAWQWYSVALPAWKEWLLGEGIQLEDVEHLARLAGFVWPVESAIGPFALHTTAAAVCGLHLFPWLLSRWYVWIMPLSGLSSHAPTGNDWLQHFELTSIVPALVLGYLLPRYLRRMATYAWVLPAVILVYKLLTFTEPQVSVLAPHSSTRWEYFFVIQRTMPTFTPGFGGVDPIRVAEQIDFVAPFYAGLAYSAGAVAETHDLVKRIFVNSRIQPETETIQMEENAEGRVVKEKEKPAHELD